MSYLKNEKQKIICPSCKKEFTLVIMRFPSRLEGRFWDTFYACPYCHDTTNIHLSGDEDVRTEK